MDRNRQLEIIGSVFRGGGQEGDFGWMILQPAYADSFFIFNDNEQQYVIHRDAPSDDAGCQPGAGNGAIRPWQCTDPPRAGGVPTGSFNLPGNPGYPALTDDVKALIDEALNRISATIAAHGYLRVFFSANAAGDLGTGTFDPAPEVTAYILAGIKALDASA